MKIYAQTSSDGVVVALSRLASSVHLPHMIEVHQHDDALIGKRWNGSAFEDVQQSEPEPVYETLKQIGFIRLIQSAGGTTQQQVLAAKDDAALAYFWLMFDMATEFERSDPEIDAGLDALVALGYLPNGKQAVLGAWPSTDLVP